MALLRRRTGIVHDGYINKSPSATKSNTGRKPIIYCGDMNVAFAEMDLKNPDSNHMNPGFTDQEREAFGRMLNAGFTDAFRYLYPDKVAYTWWSYRANAREKNVGWRIDYFILNDLAVERLKDVKIHDEVFGSDHCPIELDIDL